MRVDMIDPIHRDEVVTAIIRIALRQLDAVSALQMIDGSHMIAIGSSDFHMFANLSWIQHDIILFVRALHESRTPLPEGGS